MTRVVLFGGGRWARVLLVVLRQLLPEKTEIAWVTKHTFQSAKTWLGSIHLPNVKLLQSIELASKSVDAVVVATSPQTHFAITTEAIKLGLPTLCEKPIANSIHTARQLLEIAESHQCPLLVNLEFLFAGYLKAFGERLQDVSIHSIHIDWMDPWCENRNSEVKYTECYTDIVSDQLPHCWSVLTAIRPGQSKLQVNQLNYKTSGVELSGKFGLVPVTIRLSRRATHRTRLVSINDHNWVLDFSIEPGYTKHENSVTPNAWAGLRPLPSSLLEFISSAQDREQREWTSSFARTFNATESALLASEQLRKIQDQQIGKLLESCDLSSTNQQQVDLIVDRFAPQLAQEGLRFPVRTKNEQQQFFEYWLSSSNKIGSRWV